MKRGLIVLILAQLSFVHYGQIIADHTVVDKYDDIPQYYINEVKKMMICIAGESHSGAYRTGMTLLEALDPAYACNVATAEGYTDQHVRVENNGWWSERWWITGASNTMKNDLTSYHNNGHPFRVLGFGWCSDMLGPGASATADPEYGVKWYGRSDGGPQGSLPWGLDAGDYAITGNSVNLQTYFDAIDEYIAFCETNSPTTTMVYTTGPVNSTSGWEGEPGYQGHIKHEAIRDHVSADATRVLFDYADILCYDDDGSGATTSWDGHTYPTATSANSWPEEVGHISNAGAIRLAKAQWWLLARIAGWDGGITTIPVTTINVSSAGGLTEIMTGATLQFSAEVLPADASNKDITWSVTNGTGSGTITQGGLLTATGAGTVSVVATANDGSGVTGSMQITITDPAVPVATINISSSGGVTEIMTGATLQFSAEVLPADASNKDITWSVTNGTGSGTITQGGLLTATGAGTVSVVATANDGSGVTGSMQITITDPAVPVATINISSAGGVTEIMTGATLQFSAEVLPADASNKDITWSVTNGTGSGTITQGGLLTATGAGTVSVVATANDGLGVAGSMQITITDPTVPVTTINISSAGGVTEIMTGATLQFSAEVLPADASNKDITWSVTNGTGSGTITQGGLLTATGAGTVSVVATANDGSGVTGSMQITITDPTVPVTTINISSSGGVTEIMTGATLQFSAEVLPADASNKDITWSISNETGSGTITQGGLLTATGAGTVSVEATAEDGSGVTGSAKITINENTTNLDGWSSREIHIYPNPSRGEFFIDAGLASIDLVQIIAMEGSIIQEIIPEPAISLIGINLSNYPTGLYYLKLFSGQLSQVEQIILVH